MPSRSLRRTLPLTLGTGGLVITRSIHGPLPRPATVLGVANLGSLILASLLTLFSPWVRARIWHMMVGAAYLFAGPGTLKLLYWRTPNYGDVALSPDGAAALEALHGAASAAPFDVVRRFRRPFSTG